MTRFGDQMSDEDETTVQPAVPDERAAVPDEEATDPLRLQPAMAVSGPTGSFEHHPAPRVAAGQVYAGRYRLEQQLAQRGGTLTWRAHDEKLSRAVLVHLLGRDDERTPDVLESARKAAAATDSRFLRVLDAVPAEGPGRPAMVVCEFAPGESLEKLLEQGPLSALEAAWVARELADALGPVHAQGLFHQRLNPDTVVITATGNVKIVGFLIEAAMYPDALDGTLAWSEREQADVQAIGKVLYASLVTRWPTPADQALDEQGRPTTSWGMPAAGMDAHGWLTPRQLRSGVSPALDVICDQVLSEAPRHNELPIRTANQLAASLSQVLGTADAAADLERRMRYPLTPVGVSRPADRPGGGPAALADTARMQAVGNDRADRGRPGAEPDEPALTDPALGGWDGHGVGLGPSDPVTVVVPQYSDAPSSPSTPTEDPNAPAAHGATHDATIEQAAASLRTGAPVNSARARSARSRRPGPRRWLWLLVGAFVLSAIIGLVGVANRRSGGGSSSDGTGGGTIAVAAVRDFDPTQDGGNDQENPDQARLAIDGNPATAWRSVVYLNDSRLGRLKPGVGLVLDLGEAKEVSKVDVTLEGKGTSVQLRVPTDANAAEPPMRSARQWTSVAQLTRATGAATLTPSAPVRSRYLLVYLTDLPQVGDARYRGGVAEVTVHG